MKQVYSENRIFIQKYVRVYLAEHTVSKFDAVVLFWRKSSSRFASTESETAVKFRYLRRRSIGSAFELFCIFYLFFNVGTWSLVYGMRVFRTRRLVKLGMHA
ncbi:hypothetical protein ACJIZ3_001785 [Penstemon smallii]|uniref:Uncharacterized protein n=1 Tax=Penstemon smallii TaxID=265156 RepID=A0ABD3U4N8_9LAMI